MENKKIIYILFNLKNIHEYTIHVEVDEKLELTIFSLYLINEEGELFVGSGKDNGDNVEMKGFDVKKLEYDTVLELGILLRFMTLYDSKKFEEELTYNIIKKEIDFTI